MGARGRQHMRDAKVIPIGPHLRPCLVSEDPSTDPIVIPLRPGLFERPRRRRSTRLHVWLAGVCWIAIALL